jgi:actin-like ATPase involved in cell morphogenesis
MSWFLGVDLGTTYTAAATLRDGRTSTVELGDRTAAIPTVVFLREDETILTGDAASRRGTADPSRVAREFKRRLGDTAPILLGGSPYSAEALMAKLLRWVVDTVTTREGSPPDGIAVAHPANWGPYKQDLLGQAIARADLDADNVVTITEPEAAVTFYASQERVPPGSVVAVYDLGGGTFDAAVVRKTADGVELLGTPEGIERLGGVDFDEAVFSHVIASLGGAVDALDPDDPSVTAALVRLRAECIEAKEALSADTEVAIQVLVPGVPSSEVRLTRAELEAMIRPPLGDSITAMRRALRSADVSAPDLHAVLLAGGSSRIPLVAQLVGGELGRPVAVDAHPKYGVALGAAQAAGAAAGVAVPSPPAGADAATASPTAPLAAAAGVGGVAGAAAGLAAGSAAGASGPAETPASSASPASPTPAPGPAPTVPPAPVIAETAAATPTISGFDPANPALAAETIDMGSAVNLAGDTPTRVESAPTEMYPGSSPAGEAFAPTPAAGETPFRPRAESGGDGGDYGGDGGTDNRRRLLIVAGLAVAALVAAVGAVVLFGGGDDGGTTTDDTTTTTVPVTSTTFVPTTTEAPVTTEGGGSDSGDGGDTNTTTTSSSTTTSSTTSTSTTTTSTTTTTAPGDTTTTSP